MKKQQNNSTLASALRITLSVALISAFAILLVSSFEAAISPLQSATGTSTRSESARSQARQLSFEDRVAYQRAIEDVYWRHRIWPKENPRPKPPLDAVISRAQIEQKVAEYLRKSQFVADQREQAITPAQLQAEMDRMAR